MHFLLKQNMNLHIKSEFTYLNACLAKAQSLALTYDLAGVSCVLCFYLAHR